MIPDQGAATPYPSPITVVGATGAPVSAELRNFGHTYLSDLDVVLVSPSNVGLYLLHRQGAYNEAQSAYVTFADDAPAYPGGTIRGVQRYAPNGVANVNTLPYAGGSIPYGQGWVNTFAEFATTDPNPEGIWKLYVFDATSGDSGNLAAGWALTFGSPAVATTAPEPATWALVGAGVLGLAAAVRRRRSLIA